MMHRRYSRFFLRIPNYGVFAADETEATNRRIELDKKIKESQNNGVEEPSSGSLTDVESSNQLWYEKNPSLLESEKDEMKRRFPNFELQKLDDGKLYWLGSLSPLGDDGTTWTVMVVYEGDISEITTGDEVARDTFIKVYPVEPDIEEMLERLEHTPSAFDCLQKDSQGEYFFSSADISMTTSIRAVASLSCAERCINDIAFELARSSTTARNAYANTTITENRRTVKPQRVIFSNRAFTALLAETKEKLATETGGIFLGTMDDDVWYVIESIDPGPRSIFQAAYFEYDGDYVRHLANKVNRLYGDKLDVIGLWHRHPGSMDVFSHTDHGTIRLFAEQNNGVTISALVNIDPTFRLTMYVATWSGTLQCERIEYEVNDGLIPSEVASVLRYGEIVNNINGTRSGGGINRRISANEFIHLLSAYLKKQDSFELPDTAEHSVSEKEHELLIDQLLDNEYAFCEEMNVLCSCEPRNDNQIELVVGNEQSSLSLLFSYAAIPLKGTTSKKRIGDRKKKRQKQTTATENFIERQPCFTLDGKHYRYNGNLLKNAWEARKR